MFRFYLNMDEQSHRYITSLGERLSRLQNIRIFSVSVVNENDDYKLKDFMKLVAPLRFQEFYFKGETYKEKESIVELEYWIEEAKELCKRVEFKNCIISDSNLTSIFSSTSSKQLWFFNCHFNSASSFSFLESQSNLVYVYFKYSVDHYNDWESNIVTMEHFLSAFSKSSLVHTVKTIEIDCDRSCIQMIEDAFKKYKLENLLYTNQISNRDG